MIPALFMTLALILQGMAVPALGLDTAPPPPREISEPSVEEEEADLVPAPLPILPPYIAPPLPAPAYGLHSQISDLKGDILLMKLVGAGGVLILFIAVVGRVFSPHRAPLESHCDRETDAMLAALEHLTETLTRIGQVLAAPRPRSPD